MFPMDRLRQWQSAPDLLSQSWMQQAHHSRFRHRIVHEEHGLHFIRMHVFAAAANHILHTAKQPQPAVFVESACRNISGAATSTLVNARPANHKACHRCCGHTRASHLNLLCKATRHRSACTPFPTGHSNTLSSRVGLVSTLHRCLHTTSTAIDARSH